MEKKKFNATITTLFLVLLIIGLAVFVGGGSDDFLVQFTTDASHLDYVDIYVNIQSLQATSVTASISAILNKTSFNDLNKADIEIYLWQKYTDTCQVDDATKPIYCDVLQNKEECFKDDKTTCIYKNEICAYEQKAISCQKTGWIKQSILSKTTDALKGSIKPVFNSVPFGAKGQITDTIQAKIRINYPIERRKDNNAFGSQGYLYLNINGKEYFDFSKSSWWDTHWIYSKNLTVGTSGADIFAKMPIYAWLNGTNGHITNCNEIRVVNNTGSEIPRSVTWNYTSGNNYNCSFVFQTSRKIVNGSSENYTIYYGYPSAGETSYVNDLKQTGTQGTVANSFYVDGNTHLNFTIRKQGGLITNMKFLDKNSTFDVIEAAAFVITNSTGGYIYDAGVDRPDQTYCNRTVNESVFNTYTCVNIRPATSIINITVFNDFPIIKFDMYLASAAMMDFDIEPVYDGTATKMGFNQTYYDITGDWTAVGGFDYTAFYDSVSDPLYLLAFNETKFFSNIILQRRNPTATTGRILLGAESIAFSNGKINSGTPITFYLVSLLNSTGSSAQRMAAASEWDSMLTDQIPSLVYTPEYNITGANTAPTISITLPLNATYGNTTFTFVYKAYDLENNNFTLIAYDDGAVMYNRSNYPNNTVITNSSTKTEGWHTFTVNATDYGNNYTTSIQYYTVALTPPSIKVLSPNTTSVFSHNQTRTILLNYLVTGNTTAVDQCWYSLDYGENTSLGSCTNTTMNISTQGTHVMQVYANDSVSHVGLNTTLFDMEFQNEFRAYNSISLAQIQTFNITFSNASASASINTNSYIAYINTSALPTGSVTASWTASGYNATTSSYFVNTSFNVNVSANLYPAGLRILAYDEKTLGRLYFNLNMFNTTNNVTKYNQWDFADTIANLTKGATTIQIWNESYNDSNILYDYPQRNYYLTLTDLSNLELHAYLLREDKGINYAFVVTTYNNVPIEGASVTVSKLMNSSYNPIEQSVTDTAGTANTFLDSTVQYQVKVEAGGYVSLIFYLTPSVINRVTYVRLTATGESGANLLNITTVFDSISYALLPDNQIWNDSIPLSYMISSSANDLELYGWYVYYKNVTSNVTYNVWSLVHAENGTNPSGATLLYTTSNASGYYGVSAFFKRTNYTTYDIPMKTYHIVQRTGFGVFFPGVGGGWGSVGLQIIGILLTIFVGAFFARIHIFAGLASVLFIMAILTFGIPIFGWEIFTLVVIAAISLFVLKAVF